MSQVPPLCIRFGGFELDEATYRLSSEGRTVRIELKPLMLLLYLARHRDRVLTKEELREQLWPDTAVSEDSLFQAVLKVREALGERGAKDGVIRTVRGVGFRFNAEVEPQLEERPEAILESARSEPELSAGAALIGRGPELERIREHLVRLESGRGSVVLVEGPAGIGKSRLVREFADGLPPDRGQIHWAVTREKGGAPSHWLWVQVLRSLARSDEAGDVSEGAPSLEHLLFESSQGDESSASWLSDADEARFLLHDALGRYLTRRARERPLVLLLEDLQWIDSGSAEALTFLANLLSESPILIVGTRRDTDSGEEGALAAAREEWVRRDLIESIPLAGLGVSDVMALIQQDTGVAPDFEFASSIWSRTEGNPFFVRQVLALALSHGDPSESIAERLRAHSGGIPPEVRRVVDRRLSRLDEATRAVVAQAAAIGLEFRLAVLARVADIERTALLAALEQAIQENIIGPAAAPDRRYAFSHGLLQEVAYAKFDTEGRANVHRRIAEALEELHADHLEPVVPALARHYGEAAPLLEGTQAADYAKWAGDLARDGAAFEEAAGYFRQAILALELLPSAQPRRRAEALVCLGFALQNSGKFDEGRAMHREAVASARSAAEPSLFAAAALGLCELGVVGTNQEDVALLEEALEGLGEERGPLRIWLLSVLAQHNASLGRISQARALSKEATDRARDAGDKGWLSVALASHAAVSRLDPDSLPEARLEVLTQATALAREARNTTFEIAASAQRYGALMELARRDEAEHEFTRMTVLLERSRSSYWSFILPSLRAGLCFLDGEFDRSEQLTIEAFDRNDVPSLDLPAAKAGMIAAIRYQQGRLGELLPAFVALREVSPDLVILGGVEIIALLEAGNQEMARSRLEALSEQRFQDFVGTESWVLALCSLAEACERLGDKANGRVLYDLLEPRARHAAIVANGLYTHGPVALSLGMIATTLEDWDLAEHHLEQAFEISGSLRSPVWRAHTLAMQATVCQARGEGSAAREAAAEALESAEALGLEQVRRRICALDLR